MRRLARIARFCDKKSSITIPRSLTASDFLSPRHIGPSVQETEEMLKFVDASSLKDLMDQAVSHKIVDNQSVPTSSFDTRPLTESQFLSHLRTMYAKNKLNKTYIGEGFYNCLLPSVIQRNLLENPGWYTSYTPYQGEIAQGRLESLLNFQTMVNELTAMECCNASLLDEASAGGEAMLLALGLSENQRNKVFIDKHVFSATIEVIKTKAQFAGAEVVVGSWKNLHETDLKDFCCIIVQTPDASGTLHDFTKLFKSIDQDVLKVVATDLLASSLAKPAGEMGADICFGNSQRFGVPLGYGGPHAAFFSSKNKYIRKLPGRIIGISKDAEGNLAYRMALQTRQQHIRREKATSNICTAQALLANMAAMFAVYHGPHGLKQIASRVNGLAQVLTGVCHNYGFQTQGGKTVNYFDTVTIKNIKSQELWELFQKHDINVRLRCQSSIALSLDETTTLSDIQVIGEILAKFAHKEHHCFKGVSLQPRPIEASLQRTTEFLKQSVFNSIHSESQMMRYLQNLQSKDISLTKSMISLGSCTMKLNAASEMIPMSWPELNVHPYVPESQAGGYKQMIDELTEWLKEITKFDSISFQPNSGATGEYAGLLVIRKYLESKGQSSRRICLIPRTAHGTNPASARIAGLEVVPIDVDGGKIDVQHLKKTAEKHKKDLACLMVTFPSTAGIYQESVKQVCDVIHHYGGQVYMDGANMNAQVGWTSPGYLGADVCHLNLHKTFAIPHGGGGPGMGPIGVKKHLTPFLPSNHLLGKRPDNKLGPINSCHYGSASILNISYGYIKMLGMKGLKEATAYAVLNANYLMKKLQPHFDILYVDGGKCSHQFIVDIRPIKAATKGTEEDFAKRLMDYGFHAPTMSFPITGTLMIQPTESQDKAQLDRFAEAMIQIKKQVYECLPLVKNAPYTASSLLSHQWSYPFSREQAAYPLPWVKTRGKYWPSVRRIDNPYGDKNLICSCPDMSEYFQQK